MPVTAVAGPQAQEKPAPNEKAKDGEKTLPSPVPSPPPAREERLSQKQRLARQLDRFFEECDLKPHPQPDIPDNPPPHEGAMIALPYVVDSPDLILVELLEALPGQPISGERLIRPDGKISLGFYGVVDVKGLTLSQVKLAILKQLRKHLNDETLGLIEPVYDFDDVFDQEGIPQEFPHTKPATRPRVPSLPEDGEDPFDLLDLGKEPVTTRKPRAALERAPTRAVLVRSGPQRPSIHRIGATKPQQEPDESQPIATRPTPVVIPLPGQGSVKVTIEVQNQAPDDVSPPSAGPTGGDSDAYRMTRDPSENTRLFIDMTAYSSKWYYILGDVLIPGRALYTGNETVLDAIQYAGNLLPTAEPKDIRLVRPGRNGKPARVYKVDLEAIQDRGDVRSNYQIFPGDRLIVGRNAVVKKTIQIDRLQAPIDAIVASMQRDVNLLKSMSVLTPDRSDEVLKGLVDFWAREIAEKGDVKLDERKLRELLLRELKSAPGASAKPPAE